MIAMRPEARIKHVLCPVDFSECSKAASDFAVLMGEQFVAHVSLLHVAEEPSFAAPGSETGLATVVSMSRQRELKQALLDFGYRRHLVNHLVSAHVLVVTQRTVVQGILEAARDLGASLIVMGTHARSGVGRLIYGSTTEGVMRKSNIPVLAVPVRSWVS